MGAHDEFDRLDPQKPLLRKIGDRVIAGEAILNPRSSNLLQARGANEAAR
jgi:hypothetical protein